MRRSRSPVCSVLLLVAIVSTMLGGSPSLLAAEPKPYGNRPDDQTEYLSRGVHELPAIYADAALVEKTSDAVTLDVVVENQTTAIAGGLRLVTSVIDMEGRVVTSSMNAEKFAIEAGASKTVQVTADIKTIPTGEYLVRVQVWMGALALGWNDVAVSITSSVAPFATIDAAGVQIEQYGKQVFEPLTGPNANPAEKVTMGVFADSALSRRLTPVISLYEKEEVGAAVAELRLDPVTIKGRTLLGLPFAMPKKAGTYLVKARLLDEQGQPASNVTYDRVVVRGEAASVISAQLSTFSRSKGDYNYLTVHYSGAPDAETIVAGLLQVLIRDEQGIAGSTTPLPVTLTDAIFTNEVRVQLTRDIVGVSSVDVVINNAQDEQLATYTSATLLTESALSSIDGQNQLREWVEWVGVRGLILMAMVLTLIVLGAIAFARTLVSADLRTKRVSFAALTLVALLANNSLVFAAGNDRLPVRFNTNGINVFQSIPFVAYSHEYDNGHVSPNMPYAQIFVNRPVHNSTLVRDDLDQVPLEYSVQFGVCHNHIAGMAVYARYDKNGGTCHSTLNPPNAQWQQVHENWIRQYEQCTDSSSTVSDRFFADGDFFCIASHNNVYSGTVDLSELDPDANVVTLQIYGKASHIAGESQPGNSTTDVYWTRGSAHAVNICLNVPVAPRCGDSVINQPNEQCDDGNTNNNDSCSNTCQMQVPDIEITKTSSEQTVPQGGSFNYVLTAKNVGTILAQNVTVTDQIPPTLTITSVPSACTQNGQNVTCDIASMAVNATRSFTIGVSVPSNHVCPVTLQNTGIVNATGDVNLQNNQSTAQTQVTCITTDLEIVKTGPATVDAGDIITYKLTAKNNGSSRVDNIVVRDTIPAGLMYLDAESEADCFQAGSSVECPLTYLGGGQSRTFTLKFRVPENACGTTIVNRALVTSPSADTNAGNNNSDVTTNVAACPQQGDIVITKTAPQTLSNDNASTFTYGLTVTNTTSVPASNVTLTDTVPQQLTITSVPANCTRNGQSISCSLGTLAGNISRVFSIGVSAPARAVCAQTITNTAQVTTSSADTNSQNNQSSATTQFTCTPQVTDIQIVKGPQGIAPIYNNDDVAPFIYTLSITNNTSVSAANVTVTDSIPQSLTITSVPSGCTRNGQDVTCLIGTLAGGANRVFSIGVSAPARAFCSIPQGVTNTASVTTTTQETTLQNNQSSAQVFFHCTPQVTDLEIEKTAPATVNVSDVITYTLTAINHSSVKAEGFVISDTIPAGLTFDQSLSEQPCTQVGNTVQCDLQYLGGGQRRSVVLKFHAAQSTCGTTVTNTAIVSTTTPENQNHPNQDSAQTQIICPVQNTDIVVTKTAPQTLSNDAAVSFNYVLTVSNPTTVPATNVVMTDTIPQQFSITSLPSGCTRNANTVTCTSPTLPANGGSHSFTVVVSAPARSLCSQTVTNTASATTTTQETNLQNNQSSAATNFTCTQQQTDIRLEKSAPLSVSNDIASTFSYALTITNLTSVPAENVILTDTIPQPLSITSVPSGCTRNGNTITCAVGTLGANASRSYVIGVSAAARALCSNVVTNSAYVSTTTNDANSANNADDAQTSFTCTTVTPPVCPADGSVRMRVEFTKVANINAGDALAQVNLGNGQTVGASQPIDLIRNDLAVTDPSIPTGRGLNLQRGQNSLTFRFHGNAADDITRETMHGRIIIDGGRVTSFMNGPSSTDPLEQQGNQSFDEDAGDDEIYYQSNAYIIPFYSTVSTGSDNFKLTYERDPLCVTNADLEIVKTAPVTVNGADLITYTLTVTNHGSVRAENIVVSDTIPAGLTYDDAQSDAECSQVGNTVQCPLAYLGAGQTRSFSLKFHAAQSTCGTTVTNTATVTTTTPENQAHPNQASAQTQIICPQATFAITKTDNRTQVQPSEQLTYVLTVTNSSSVAATNVTVRDTLPSYLTYVSSSAGGVNAGQVVTWSSLAFAPFEQKTFTVTATVNAATPNNTILHNVATVNDTVQAFDDTTVIVPVTTGCINIVKNALDEQGQPITPVPSFLFRLSGGQSVTSNASGTAQFTNVAIGSQTVTEDLPTGWLQTSVVPAGGLVTVTANQCATVTFTNTRNLGVDIGVTKATSVSSVLYGSQITYTIVATNAGPADAQNVVIKDVIPAGMTFVSASGVTCTNVNGEIQCQIGSLPKNQSTPIITVTLTAPATPTVCTASSVTNTAVVQTSSTDTNAANNQSSVTTQLTCPQTPTSDLGILKTGQSTIVRGNNLIYTLNITNTSTATVANTYTVTDAVPTGLTFVPTGSSANCTLQGTNVVCTGTIASGNTVPLTLVFSVPTIANCVTTVVTNTATVASQLTDTNTANNTSSFTTSLTCPVTNTDISVSKSGPSTVQRGGTITYTITAVNNGPSTATNVIITDAFSSEFTYASASGATCTTNGNVLTCNLGTMTSGQSTPISVTFNVRTVSGTCATSTVTNIATITSDTTDTNLSNNTSNTVTTQLTCDNTTTNEITVFKTDNRTTANVLDRIRYSIILTNSTSSAINDLLVTDNVPYGLTILTVSDGGSVSSQQVRWTGISVPANSSRTLYIDAEVRNDVGNGTVLHNIVDVSGKTASDQTTVYNNTYNPPPPYYPPVIPPPPYYPPVIPPPPYYPPTITPPPPVIYPQTGDEGAELFAPTTDDSQLTPVTAQTQEEDNGFSAVFYATLIAFLAVGSAAASRFIGLGL